MAATGAWRWYTKARRVPSVIGKDSAGRRIPGGPYTVVQVIAVPVTATLAWQTQDVWGAGMVALARIITVVVVTIATVKLLGKVDFASRNPIYLATAYARQAFGPAGGRLGMTPVKPQRLSHVRSNIDAATHTPAAPETTAPTERTVAEPTPAARTATTETAAAAAPLSPAPSPTPAATPTTSTPPTSDPSARPARTRPARTRANPETAGVDAAPPKPQRQTGLQAFLHASDRKDAA